MKNTYLTKLAALATDILFAFTIAYADGFDLKKVRKLTEDGGASMFEIEELYGEPIEKVEIAKSDTGCVEAWMFSEVIMDGISVKALQMLTVFFDEDGYVCGTYLTDGDKLNEEKDRVE